MKRGEVRWYKFQHPNKKRPVVILTRNATLEFLNEITIAPLTINIRHIPSEVILNKNDGMPRNCAINLDNIQTVSKHKLGAIIATLNYDIMQQVNKALAYALDLNF